MTMIHRTAQEYVITFMFVDLAVWSCKSNQIHFLESGTGYHQSGNRCWLFCIGYGKQHLARHVEKKFHMRSNRDVKEIIAMCYADPSKAAKVTWLEG